MYNDKENIYGYVILVCPAHSSEVKFMIDVDIFAVTCVLTNEEMGTQSNSTMSLRE